jgi:glyceraldehyde-3-phosphate dehydrogenase (ferredoxin)
MHNAELGVALLHEMVRPHSRIPLKLGPRKFARRLGHERGKRVMDCFVYNAFARQGWMVPNQYWTPGVLSPMAIMGKYYMHYGKDFLPPYQLGQENAKRMLKELMLDNLGFCRFHRAWAEDMMPDIVEELFGCRDAFLRSLSLTAGRINSRNASIFWEPERNIDIVWSFLKKKKETDGLQNDQLEYWLERFTDDKHKAALDFWYEMHKGIHESLREFPD